MSAVDTWTAPLTKSGEMEKRHSQRISPSLGGLGNFNESLGNDLLVIQVEGFRDFFLQVDLAPKGELPVGHFELAPFRSELGGLLQRMAPKDLRTRNGVPCVCLDEVM